MNPFLKAIVIAVLFSPAAFASETSDVSLQGEVDKYLEKSANKWDDPSTLRVFWNKAIAFESSDGMFKLKVGGRLMWDNFWTSTGSTDFSGANPYGSGTFFRRVRMYMSGDVYGKTTFKIQIDFVSSQILKDVYVGIKKLWGSGGTLLFGHQKEAFSIYELTSSKYIQMIERPMAVSAFSPSRHSGVGLYSGPLANKRMTFGAFFGWGQSGGNGSFNGSGGGAFTFRVTGLALSNKEKKTWLHLGFSGSYRNYAGNAARFRTRPNTGTGPRVADTGTFDAQNAFLYSFEVAFIWRSLDVVAEYIGAETSASSSTAGGDHSFGGWYIEVGYWVTGETKKYDVKRGTFGRTSPKKNFGDGQGGWGAIQVVVRFDSIDLNSTDGGFVVAGGKTTAISGGVNWHWNPNTRVMFNIIFAEVDNGPLGTGDITGFVVRMQWDF